MKKIKLALLVLATTLGIGCGKNNYTQIPPEHYFSVGGGVLLPGKAKEQEIPNSPILELDYNVKLNQNWGVGMTIKAGRNSESTSADIINNIPSTDSTTNTFIYKPYLQWQKHFGDDWENRLNVRLGASMINQNKDIEIGAPINKNENYNENTKGISISTRYDRFNKKLDKSFYIQIEHDIINGTNVSNTTTISTGANFKFK